jgi:hypothetical protein
MTKNNLNVFILVLALVLILSPFQKSFAVSEADIRKVIGESTPDFIAKPIISVVNTLENFRTKNGLRFAANKAEAEAELILLDYKFPTSFKDINLDDILNALKTYSMYAMATILAWIFAHALVFYGILLFLFLAILKYFLLL